MGKKNKWKAKKKKTGTQPELNEVNQPALPQAGNYVSIWIWMLPVLVITAGGYLPVFNNQLTNWDDEYYVVQNYLLRGPDWKGIFTQPVVSNYHPVTIISLAFNYALTGLDASSYLITNFILHLINTVLVFYFIYTISGKKVWVAAFTALIFGIHPMHVESVAWVSERKDLLYTLFFLLSLMQYWRYLETGRSSKLLFSFLFFVLSILSKPAAIILPLVLLLLDYWKGRSFSSKMITEKIAFFLVSAVLAIITVKLQSKTAIAGLDFYPLWTRFFFATYVTTIYVIRFLVPWPLSAFHPYPPPSDLGWPVLASPLFIIALLVFLWYQRKNRLVIFSIGFFIVNLILVMQVISIGATIVAERYTYVPYISLAFLVGMWLDKYRSAPIKPVVWLIAAAATLAFGYITYKRTDVWQNSGRLWDDVIKRFPNAPVPRTNRANHTIRSVDKIADKDSVNRLLQQALEDCNVALKNNPNHAKGYENRQNIYLRFNQGDLALADANSLIRLQPNNRLGYYTRGVVYVRTNKPDSALADFNKCLQISPNTDYALNNRGSLLVNHFQRYDEALADFNKAIQINPQGDYYLNRSICYYRKGDMDNAKADAKRAMDKGVKLPDNYRQVLGW